MAKSNASASKKDLPTPNGWVDKIVGDPKNPNSFKIIIGLVGSSSEANHLRIYTSQDLKNYVDIPNELVLHFEQNLSTDGPDALVSVWVKTEKDSKQKQDLLKGETSAESITWGDDGSCPTKGCWTNEWTCPSDFNACRTDINYPHPFCNTTSGSNCNKGSFKPESLTWGAEGECPTKGCWTNNWTCPSENNACRTDINYPHPFCNTTSGSNCNKGKSFKPESLTWGDEGSCPTKGCWTNEWTCPSDYNACRTDINYPHPFCNTTSGSNCNKGSFKPESLTWGDEGECPTKGCWTNKWTCPSEHNSCKTDINYPHPFCRTESGNLCK